MVNKNRKKKRQKKNESVKPYKVPRGTDVNRTGSGPHRPSEERREDQKIRRMIEEELYHAF